MEVRKMAVPVSPAGRPPNWFDAKHVVQPTFIFLSQQLLLTFFHTFLFKLKPGVSNITVIYYRLQQTNYIKKINKIMYCNLFNQL